MLRRGLLRLGFRVKGENRLLQIRARRSRGATGCRRNTVRATGGSGLSAAKEIQSKQRVSRARGGFRSSLGLRSGRGSRCGIGCAGTSGRGDIIVAEEIDGGLGRTTRWGLTGRCGSVRCRTLNLGLFLHNRKGLLAPVSGQMAPKNDGFREGTYDVVIAVVQG